MIYQAFLCIFLLTLVKAAPYNQTLAFKFWDFIRITDCSVANIQALNCGPICKQYQSELKYIEVAFNESTNMLAWVGYSSIDDLIYVNFRGSIDSAENWLHNIDYFQSNYPDTKSSNAYPSQNITCQNCKVHTGFYNGYYSLRQQVLTAYDSVSKQSGCKKLFVVGYSLGAAMATHAVLDIIETQTQFTAEGLYTFGCPRTGNKNFADYFDSNVPNSYRITHYKDMVPHVPLVSMGFYHTQQEIWYNSDTTLDHILCVGGEDRNCSMSETILNVYDHLHYLNEDVDILKSYCNGIGLESVIKKFLNKQY